jgi:membrane-bound lytic murein transglycosylase D
MGGENLISRIVLAILLVGCAGGSFAASPSSWRNPDATAAASRKDPFPMPLGLGNAVFFWRQVFGVWSRSQVALHDDEHLGIVYDVLALSGEIEDQRPGALRHHF